MGTFLKDFGAKNHEKASQLGARGLERNRAGVSNRAEPAENRRAQRRHRLGRHTRNPASNSHGRLEIRRRSVWARVAGGSVEIWLFFSSVLAIVVHVESGGTWTQVGADIDGDMGGRSRTSALPIRYVPLSLLLILFFARSLTAQVVKLPLSLGDHFTCVILDDLSLKCFGRNTLGFGMLGLGTDGDDRGDNPGEMGDNLPTVDLGSGRLLMSVASGIDHSCAILDDLTLKCWGRNDMGMLGLGDTNHRGDSPGEMGDSLPTVDVGSGKTVNRVSASYHTCVILDDSSVKCWGRNGDGWLGYGDTLTRGELPNEMGNSLPVVNLGENMKATDISLGLGHTCALLHDTSVKCWGRNNLGQLGDGTLSNKYIPTLATEVSAKSISCGGDNTCAILTDDSVKCWGGNSFGDVSSMKAKAIALGLNHLCLILLDGSVWCSDIGSVDLGTGRTAKQISSGKVHTCVVLDDNLLACWGLKLECRWPAGIGRYLQPMVTIWK